MSSSLANGNISEEKLYGKKFPTPHYKWPIVTDEMRQAVLKQLDISISIYDRTSIVKELEANFMNYHGMKYGFVCNSGTIAILNMMNGIGIQPGDEVIAPAYTFFATASPMMILGAVPVFADCLPDGNIDPADIEKKITSNTKAVIITHMWGIPCEMDAIVAICKKHGLKLLEDCSHSHGAEYKGKKVGTFGDAGAWSMQSAKVIAGGQAGILLTNSEDIYVRANLLSSFNKRCYQEIPKNHPLYSFCLSGFGLNHRIHPLAAAIANQQFQHLDEWLTQKNEYAQQFLEAIKSIPFLEPPIFPNRKPTWYAFVMQFKPEACTVSIDEFIEKMHELSLFEIERPRSTGPIYKLPLFTTPSDIWPGLYKNIQLKDQGEFPVADQFYENAVKLPVWANESDQELVQAYIDGLLKVAEEISK